MNAVVSINTSPKAITSALAFNAVSQRKDWFDEPTGVRSLEAERRHLPRHLAILVEARRKPDR